MVNMLPVLPTVQAVAMVAGDRGLFPAHVLHHIIFPAHAVWRMPLWPWTGLHLCQARFCDRTCASTLFGGQIGVGLLMPM